MYAIEEKVDSPLRAEVSTRDTDIHKCCSSCKTCHQLKKKLKSLQITLSWYKKTKAVIRKKFQQLGQKNKNENWENIDSPMASEDVFDEYWESDEELNEEQSSRSYSSFEESSQSGDMDDDTTRNTDK